MIGLLLSMAAVVAACSSGDDAAQRDLSSLTPEETRSLYLKTICDSGHARLTFGFPVQSVLENGVGDLDLAENSLADAINKTRTAAAILLNETAPWPEEIRDEVRSVGEEEELLAQDLDEFFSGVDAEGLPNAYEAFSARPDQVDSSAGEVIRDFYNLGEAGDCPRASNAEELFSLLVTSALPSFAEADQTELLSAGRDICALSKEGLDSEDLIIDELSTRGISALEAGVLVSGAERFLCPSDPLEESWSP